MAEPTYVTLNLEARLGGHPSTEGTLEAVEQPRGQRTWRAVGTMALFVVIAAVVVFIPPHIPWVLIALFTGGFLAFRQARSDYRVVRMSIACPRCGNELTVEEGQGVRLPMKMTCFECHHEPVISAAARD